MIFLIIYIHLETKYHEILGRSSWHTKLSGENHEWQHNLTDSREMLDENHYCLVHVSRLFIIIAFGLGTYFKSLKLLNHSKGMHNMNFCIRSATLFKRFSH